MKIRTIPDRIDLGSMALPGSRRGDVRDRDQVRGLMHSLYRKHPVGSLLVRETRTENARARGDGPPGPVQARAYDPGGVTGPVGPIAVTPGAPATSHPATSNPGP